MPFMKFYTYLCVTNRISTTTEVKCCGPESRTGEKCGNGYSIFNNNGKMHACRFISNLYPEITEFAVQEMREVGQHGLRLEFGNSEG
jgi:hypothetical protein